MNGRYCRPEHHDKLGVELKRWHINNYLQTHNCFIFNGKSELIELASVVGHIKIQSFIHIGYIHKSQQVNVLIMETWYDFERQHLQSEAQCAQ